MKIHSIFLSFVIVFCLSSTQAKGQTIKDELVTDLIQKKRSYNKENGFGFRIQLNNGFEKEVKLSRSKFKVEYPLILTYILFESPDWKVQVGNYRTRLEADKALNKIKLKFREAIVVPR